MEQTAAAVRSSRISPQAYARAAGALYLIIFAAGFFSVGVQSKLIAENNAAATAANIMASQALWRIATGAEVVMFGCDFALAVLFYILLSPINAGIALLAAFFRLGQAIICTLNVVWQFAPILLLGGSAYATTFSTAQLHALALLSLKLYDRGFAIALIPFGIHCVLLGYLIFKARYLPKMLGALLVIAGACYVTNSFSIMVAPTIAGALYPWILVPAFLAELALCLWLLIFGVSISEWNDCQRLQRMV